MIARRARRGAGSWQSRLPSRGALRRQGTRIGLAGMLLFALTPRWASADPATAAQFYQSSCARCHGADGHNPRLVEVFPDLPDFASPKWQATHRYSELKRVILRGGKDGMPGYQEDLDGIKVKDLVQYLRQFARPAPKP